MSFLGRRWNRPNRQRVDRFGNIKMLDRELDQYMGSSVRYNRSKLDEDIEHYMSKTKSHLDKSIDDYMSKAKKEMIIIN